MAFDWTEERVAKLKHLVLIEKATASQICAELGATSRNAVIGKIHRLGLVAGTARKIGVKGRPRKAQPSAPMAEEITAVPSDRRRSAFITFNLKSRSRAGDPGFVEHEPAPPGGVPLLALRNHHCRWPLGDPREPGFRFCGGCRADERNWRRPYCAEHEAIAYDARGTRAA